MSGATAALGMRARISRFSSNHRSITVIVGMTIFTALCLVLPGLPPFSLFQPTQVWVDGFANAGVYVLLALGLNIVVGLAGLLDLGYAAFFAIGAYVYAFGASPFSGNEFPFLPMLFIGALFAMLFGVLLGAPTLRLRGDYLAIMTLGFGEIVPIVFLNADRYTEGTNGIGGIYRPDLLGIDFKGTDPYPYFFSSTGSRIPGSGGRGWRSARTSSPRRRTGSTPSRRSSSPSRSGRPPPGSPASSTPRSSRSSAPTSSSSPSRSRSSRWSSSAGWGTSGASRSERSSSTTSRR
jgi:hypothetical protein